jgi:excisionase family DNA binding protein
MTNNVRYEVMPQKALLTREETAEELSLPVRSVDLYLKRGLLKATKLGRHIRILRSSIDDLAR